MPRRKSKRSRRRRSRLRSFVQRVFAACIRPDPADEPDSDEDLEPKPDSNSEVDSHEADPGTVMEDAVQLQSKIGYGTFGSVFKGQLKGEEVAVKRINAAFKTVVSAKDAYRETLCMTALKHPNILELKGGFLAEDPKPVALCLVTEKMETDLFSMLQDHIVDPSQKSFIMYQLLSALTYMHARNLIHRDVKPENMLLNKSSYLVKLCDFGMARSLSSAIDESCKLTPRFGCPHYWPPETIVRSECYTKAVDVWAAGAVLFELFLEFPLIGECTVYDLRSLVCLLPNVTVDDAASLHPPNLEAVKNQIIGVCKPQGSTSLFELMISGLSKELQDLSYRMLSFSPLKRCTMEQALEHPAFAHLHVPQRETTPTMICPALSDWKVYGIAEYKKEVEKMIAEANARLLQQ